MLRRRAPVAAALGFLLLALVLLAPGGSAGATSDSDHDGMPDAWEKANGFDPTDPSDAKKDADGDGLSNVDEYVHGTDPHRPDTNGNGVADGDELHIDAAPSLWPRFRPNVSDYVNRCAAEQHVRIWVAAPKGTTVSVDGGSSRTGSFSVRRPLAPGQELSFSVSKGGHSKAYHVRCVPAGFPAWDFRRSARPSRQFYVVTPALSPYTIVFDRHGVPVWWQQADGPIPYDAKVLPAGRIGWFVSPNPYTKPPVFEVHRLDGSVATKVHARGPQTEPTSTDSHDIQLLPNGDWLVARALRRPGTVDLSECGGPKDAVVYDDEIQRVRPGVKDPIWSWNSKDHTTISETGRWCPSANVIGTKAYDLMHVNSLQLVGGAVIISSRHTDAVYKIDYRTKKILWKLGGTKTAQSLQVMNDPYPSPPTFGGQHFAHELPDGTVAVHDNGTGLMRPPRAVRYRIDEEARTATLLEQWSGPRGHSICCGSAEKLPDGGWLISWGAIPVVTELGPNGHPRFTLTLRRAHTYTYRVFGVADGELSAQALRAGMDAMNPRPR